MTSFLTQLFGRLPIGWLQLTHSKSRLAAALAGVAFANILIFMQLGFLGALNESVILPYRAMSADVLISASDTNTLSDGGNVARQRMFQALAASGVKDAMPLYTGRLDWETDEGSSASLQVFGVDPGLASAFFHTEQADLFIQLALPDRAIIDTATRNIEPSTFDRIRRGETLTFEGNGRTITLIDTVTIGAGFESDGYLFVSDQTFLRLFPKRSAGAPNHIFVNLEPEYDATQTIDNISRSIDNDDVIIRRLMDAAAADQTYQTTERPVGVVFGFGVIIGVLVGVIIVYQVLSTDVADHLKEYATLKAVGYAQSFFLGIVFEEALILALFGFVPGILISLGLYELVSAATGLPLAMTSLRAVGVLISTIIMCVLSGAIATRRLAAADPADLF